MTAIQLTRLTIAFGAISDLWFIILITRANDEYNYVPVFDPDLPLWAALLTGAVVAIGLFAYGASLNDILDIRHDSAFSPDRPIPAGRIRPGQAVVVTVGALIVAVLGGAGMGMWSVCITLLTAAGLLFYNAAGKFIPAVGVLTIGLLHAAHMLIPNHQLMFTLPIWLIMTHSMCIATAVHVLEGKRPRFRKRSIILLFFGWLVWSALILGVGMMPEGSIWPPGTNWTGIIPPLLAVIAFLIVAWWKVSVVSGKVAAEKLKRYGAMWQSLYGAMWLMGLGLYVQAMWIGLFAIAGFTAMTLIKEMSGLTGKPIEYRS
ncbi:MAG: UbiA family prenyltransferase [Planctomycetota bacterium]|nr:UbiA family prenyltransferase [Planctomycetota bacterium]